jgi:hypothetical protein
MSPNETFPLLDSWWYFKGAAGGVTTWDARPDVFPLGLTALSEATSWPLMLHNRYWDPDTPYSTRNGGAYKFIHDGSDVVVPDDALFWAALIANKTVNKTANKTRAGLFSYEQDWLSAEVDLSRALGESASLGSQWMLQMSHGCELSNVTIQLCMSYPRHILQSVEMAAATNARASGDYIHPGPGGGHQWDIGMQSLFTHALGLAPSKDTFWSTEQQPGNPYGQWGYEPHSRLQSAVLAFSAGPVAPSDKIGTSDVALIMKACTTDGTLLSPERPATLSDASFIGRAFPNHPAGADGQLWLTHSVMNGSRYGYVLAPELASSFALKPTALGFDESAVLIAVRPADTPTNASGSWVADPPTVLVSAESPLELRACTLDHFEAVLLAPRLEGGWHLLGEPSKWVSVSSQRFLAVVSSGSSATAWVAGAPGEEVTVAWMTPPMSTMNRQSSAELVQKVCIIGASGKAACTVTLSVSST